MQGLEDMVLLGPCSAREEPKIPGSAQVFPGPYPVKHMVAELNISSIGHLVH